MGRRGELVHLVLEERGHSGFSLNGWVTKTGTFWFFFCALQRRPGQALPEERGQAPPADGGASPLLGTGTGTAADGRASPL
jgi:hypothetical protein